ncbi:hypothetical protein FE244_03255 [Aliarcobacter thereius]|uniref:GNAT family N-acetyltransferase n=2 Tax=Aliarcobacter thereius TaxID=544718 RepID=A0A5R9H2Z3_9BACT|nr:hypothetical protein FE246_01055 [Aliarcobacter thereius]TLS93639.1 hypothetical protein FE244_03255 [Aliarcobacter thereius]
MELIKLNKNHINDFKNINNITKKELENPDFFIGFFSDEEISEILNQKENFEDTIFYGFFKDEKLLSISGLFFDVYDFKDELNKLNIVPKYCAEIGASMTLRSARGQKCMLNLNKRLLALAKEKNIKYIIATAHPKNIASNKSLQNLNMKFIKEIIRSNYPRNLYILELS